jgi:hypothetical protein
MRMPVKMHPILRPLKSYVIIASDLKSVEMCLSLMARIRARLLLNEPTYVNSCLLVKTRIATPYIALGKIIITPLELSSR